MKQFNPMARGFDLKNALFFAKMSELAYKGPQAVTKVLTSEYKFPKTQFIKNKETETQGFMAANTDIILLSFRGTEKNKVKDWLTDANIRFVKGPWGNVHEGFYEALESVWPQICDVYLDFYRTKQALWITGHSLGGALATLAAAKCVTLPKMPLLVKGVYTFGAPRVGNKTFARRYDAVLKRKTFRVVNSEDIVTRVPPRLGGYDHVGSVIYFTDYAKMMRGPKKWKVVLDRSMSKIVRAVDRYNELQKYFPNGLQDHGLGGYISKIEKNLKKAKNTGKRTSDFLNYVNG